MQEENDEDGCDQQDRRRHEDELRLKAVAAQVVQDVLSQAPQTALERVSAQCGNEQTVCDHDEDEDELPPPPFPDKFSNFSFSHTDPGSSRALQRLPTIQIDTVPSAPGSPTEWPSPPPEATIREEDEDEVCEDHIQLAFEYGAHEQHEDLQDYAKTYIDDLLGKAVQLAEERKRAQDTERAREIATKVVDDVISQASESASKKSGATTLVHTENLPTFQIDTVTSMPPSPASDDGDNAGQIRNDNEDKQQTGIRPDIPEITYDFSEDIKFEGDDDEKLTENVSQTTPRAVKYKDAPKQLQDFAKSYIKDVITRAVTAAEEKAIHSVPFNFDEMDIMKTNGPWYIRVREAFMRVLRTACFCTPRRNDS